jgi:hypothetical protein
MPTDEGREDLEMARRETALSQASRRGTASRSGSGIPSCLRVRDARVRLLPVHALHDVGERDRLA